MALPMAEIAVKQIRGDPCRWSRSFYWRICWYSHHRGRTPAPGSCAATGTFPKAQTPDKGIDDVFLDELGNVFVGLNDWTLRHRRLLDCAGDLLVERLLTVPTPFCLLCCEKEPHGVLPGHDCQIPGPKGWRWNPGDEVNRSSRDLYAPLSASGPLSHRK